jgi:hypothetical protein
MKGFAITPVLLTGLILAGGIMLLTFSVIDSAISAGIAREAAISSLSEDFAKNVTSAGTLLFFRSMLAATFSADRTSLESAISSMMAGRVKVSECAEGYFVSSYEGRFSSERAGTGMDRSYSVSRKVTCRMVMNIMKKNATVDCMSCP